jgi:hypothetical protein
MISYAIASLADFSSHQERLQFCEDDAVSLSWSYNPDRSAFSGVHDEVYSGTAEAVKAVQGKVTRVNPISLYVHLSSRRFHCNEKNRCLLFCPACPLILSGNEAE